MKSTTCPNGHENPPGTKYCGECGAPLPPSALPSEAANAETVVGSDVPAPPTETHEQAAKPRNWTPILGIGLVLGVAIIGLLGWLVLSSRGGSAGPLAETHDIKGSLVADECGGGYNIEGAAVDIRDEKDKLIGSATTSFDSGSGTGCTVNFRIPDVPKASFYQITIGTHGGPSYSYSEMKAAGWSVDLSL
jgi:hypothetical protein